MLPYIKPADNEISFMQHRQAFYNFSVEAHHFAMSRTPSIMMAQPSQPQDWHHLAEEPRHVPRRSCTTKACPNCGFTFRLQQDVVGVSQDYCSKG